MAASKRPQRQRRDGSTAKPRVAKSSAVPSVAAQTASLAKLSDKKLAAMFKGKTGEGSPASSKPAMQDEPEGDRQWNIGGGQPSGGIPIEYVDGGGNGGGGPDQQTSGGGDSDVMRMLLEEVRDLKQYLKQKFDAD